MQEYKVTKVKYISLPARYLEDLRKEFNVSSECVRLALNYKTYGEQPEAIRARAKEMNGFDAYKAM